MSRIRFRAAALSVTVVLTACAGLKDALTAHVDTVARAGSQELTVQRLSAMMAAAKAPARKDVALAIANIWVNYQLLGEAAARGDSLNDQKLIDDGMWAQVAQLKLRKLFAAISKASPIDSSSFEKHYNAGDMLAARHILVASRKNVAKPAERDAAKKKAEGIAKQVNAGNFAAMAKKYSEDPGSKDNSGDLGVFAKGQMVAEFQAGVLALKPGEITAVPVESDFGYHIIMRETWADAKPAFAKAYTQIAQQSAESTYGANIEKAAKVEVKPAATKTIRAVAADLDAFRDDRTEVATAKGVSMTAAKVAKWMAAYPPQTQIREKLQQLPDSVMGLFAKQLVVNELMLLAADSAKITLDSAEKASLKQVFVTSVWNSYNGLGITPASLTDSGKTVAAREKIAAARVEKFMDALLANKAQFVDVSEPVSRALRTKFEARVVTAGLDRAVEEAKKATAKADSAAAKNMPPSAVPAPGAQAAPTPAPAPPPTKKP